MDSIDHCSGVPQLDAATDPVPATESAFNCILLKAILRLSPSFRVYKAYHAPAYPGNYLLLEYFSAVADKILLTDHYLGQ